MEWNIIKIVACLDIHTGPFSYIIIAKNKSKRLPYKSTMICKEEGGCSVFIRIPCVVPLNN